MPSFVLYALAANFCFALASMGYSHYSKKVSPLWMNSLKAWVAFALFALVVVARGEIVASLPSALLLLSSGLIGLCIGDIFLLRAFTVLGPGRTLIMFGFQPLLIGLLAYGFFDQALDARKLWAILFFIGCLISFGMERFKQSKSFGLDGLGLALAAIFLDACGVMMTRQGFELTPELHAMEANFLRSLGAVIGFVVIGLFSPIRVFSKLKDFAHKEKAIILFFGALGTVVSLSFYLNAIKTGHLGVVTGIAITGPMFASTFESLWTRTPPSRYLLIAYASFAIGMTILLQ